MVARRKESLLSQFSRSSPDEGSAPDGACPTTTAAPSAVFAASSGPDSLATLLLTPLCSSFSSILSRLVRRVRAAADGPPTDVPLEAEPPCCPKWRYRIKKASQQRGGKQMTINQRCLSTRPFCSDHVFRYQCDKKKDRDQLKET